MENQELKTIKLENYEAPKVEVIEMEIESPILNLSSRSSSGPTGPSMQSERSRY